MQEAVSCDTIGDLDNGSARLLINAAISAAVRDVDDRGSDRKPRQVHIILTFDMMDNEMIAVHVEAAVKTPKFRSNTTVTMPRQGADGAKLLFQKWAPDDPRQRTIDEAAHNHDSDEG